MKAPAILLLLLIASSPLLWGGEKPDRTWTNTQGKAITGTYRRCDGISVWIKTAKGESAVPLASLSPADQAVVKEFQNDFSWKLRSVIWPGSIFSPATRPALEVLGMPKGALPTFRTPGFEFQVDEKLLPITVGDFGRTFEATRELFARLPWDIRPAPPEGKHYKVRLYSKRADFTAALKISDEGSARTMGLYVRNDRTIHLPLESLTGHSLEAKDTLRHELTHQMMHDLLPLMPWWVAEGTAEYIRIIPWENRGAYVCDKVFTPAVMKKLAGEGPMNRLAFSEMLKDQYTATPEADNAQRIETARHQIAEALLKIRHERAEMLAGRGKPAPRRAAPQAGVITEQTTMAEFVPFNPGGTFSDEGRATVLKYHAAKMLVYYLQHLEGDGKGAKMFSLVWHLRQWADELAGVRTQFEKMAEAFHIKFKEVQARAKDFDKMETAYQDALLNWRRTSTGRSTDPPKPLAPEEELLNLLPPAPSAAFFTPFRLQTRWLDIKKKTIGEAPEKLYDDIITAFKKWHIDLPVLEGDPRAIKFAPVKVRVFK